MVISCYSSTMTPVQTESGLDLTRDSNAALSRLRRCTSLAVSMDSGDAIPSMVDEERPKTRRVNPQRLALRLGPDLVAEMEALIVPGAKMPTFAVRKDFQDRYCVDRRHIYDYFHSRGLRVAKEDKHTNLKRRRIMKHELVQMSTSPVPKLPVENFLQIRSGHTLTPAVAAEFLSKSKSSPLQFPKRAATYPGNLHAKRVKKAVPMQNISPSSSLSTSTTPSVIDVLSTSSSEPGVSIEVSDLYSPDISHIEQPSDGSPLSGTHDSQHEDFLPALGNTWALDQCNDLYDLLDGESYIQDLSHPAEPFQVVQQLFMRPDNHGSSDLVSHSLGDNANGTFEGLSKIADILGNLTKDI